jgi:hypothetical protein
MGQRVYLAKASLNRKVEGVAKASFSVINQPERGF